MKHNRLAPACILLFLITSCYWPQNLSVPRPDPFAELWGTWRTEENGEIVERTIIKGKDFTENSYSYYQSAYLVEKQQQVEKKYKIELSKEKGRHHNGFPFSMTVDRGYGGIEWDFEINDGELTLTGGDVRYKRQEGESGLVGTWRYETKDFYEAKDLWVLIKFEEPDETGVGLAYTDFAGPHSSTAGFTPLCKWTLQGSNTIRVLPVNDKEIEIPVASFYRLGINEQTLEFFSLFGSAGNISFPGVTNRMLQRGKDAITFDTLYDMFLFVPNAFLGTQDFPARIRDFYKEAYTKVK